MADRIRTRSRHIGGGTIANGGGGRTAAQAALRRAGLRAASTSLLSWTAVIGCDIAIQVGSPLVTAFWRTSREVRTAERAEQEHNEE